MCRPLELGSGPWPPDKLEGGLGGLKSCSVSSIPVWYRNKFSIKYLEGFLQCDRQAAQLFFFTLDTFQGLSCAIQVAAVQHEQTWK